MRPAEKIVRDGGLQSVYQETPRKAGFTAVAAQNVTKQAFFFFCWEQGCLTRQICFFFCFFFASWFSFTRWLCTSVNLCKVVGVCDMRQRAGVELSWKSLHRWHCFCFFRSHKWNNFDGGLQREGEVSNFSFCGRAGSGKKKKTRPGSRPAVSGPQRSSCFDASRVFVRE